MRKKYKLNSTYPLFLKLIQKMMQSTKHLLKKDDLYLYVFRPSSVEDDKKKPRRSDVGKIGGWTESMKDKRRFEGAEKTLFVNGSEVYLEARVKKPWI